MDSDDASFYPCPCLYQVCRFCWAKIINEENGLCPACRQPYNPDAPVVRAPQTSSVESKRKPTKRKKEVANKPQIPKETFKLLPELRVIQTNLVFVVGLPQWISKDKEILKGPQYFGQFGKVFKVEVNANQTFTGPQGQPSISAYITYCRPEDAMRAVLTLDQSMMHGRQLRVSLGTTKYCSQFLRGHKCNKHECMYLHDLGDPKASFTKEQMHAGKHTEYMKTLLDDFIANQHPTVDTRSRGSPAAAVGSGGSSSQEELTTSASKSSVAADAFRHSKDGSTPDTGEEASAPSSGGVFTASSYSSSQLSSERAKPLFQSQSRADMNSLGPSSSSSGNSAGILNSPDIDFDPIRESQAGLAELLASEHPPPPQVSLATQTHFAPLPPMFAPPPGFENFPAASPEDFASLITATPTPQSLLDTAYEQFAQLAALAYQAQQQQQHHHWGTVGGMEQNMEFLTHLLRQAMHLDGKESSQASQPSSSIGNASGAAGEFKCYATSASATTAALDVSRGSRIWVAFAEHFIGAL
ncbi:unnamed protein product [Mesocestoides corti]|uniref:RRM domain-containing protein n=1 Tax=Mesocestoides corti TaxID=53468 RepID=A0A0R3U357_MESCO|nr:unnamed protein product [Mesocestoides corti]